MFVCVGIIFIYYFCFYYYSRQSVKDVLTMCKMGVISPNISETLTLDQVNEALEHFSTDKSSGKILLKVTK